MKTLSTEHRRLLERTVVGARDVAEAGARGALEALAVPHHEPYRHMSGEQRRLRNRLRAHARHLGDRVDARSGAHTIAHLVHECAYEHWHGMLFARFLAENHLLIEPEMGIAITLNECEELAKEESVDKWALAARFAHDMLPQVFRPDHPVFEVQLAREYRLKLEGLVEGLPAEVFTATDALGWVYQFWQTKKKDEVNRSAVKIGADELPAVTQLFTEPYMVQFLLHNSLGSWWVSRHPDNARPVELTYLRRTDDGAPAAGAFERWPDNLSEFRLLDPCCGSGHFLVAALLMLVPMRMTLEGLNSAAAVDAVLRENLHGLELDQRCVAIAAFALAIEAWRYPGTGGYRTLPKLNLAWCGQPVAGKREQWLVLAEGDERLAAGMAALYDTFRDAPTLGSLIDPARSIPEDMFTAGFEELQPLLERALREHAGEEEWEETAIAALGLAEATRLLRGNYHLVVTNVPYLARGRQIDRLRRFCDHHYVAAKHDLANVFLERCFEFCRDKGVTASVMPQNWLYLSRYKRQRENLLRAVTFGFLARLGPGAFDSIGGEVVKVILLIVNNHAPTEESMLHGLGLEENGTALDKALALRKKNIQAIRQSLQYKNPDSRILLSESTDEEFLNHFADSRYGLRTADTQAFVIQFWEIEKQEDIWVPHQSTVVETTDFGGRESLLRWENGKGSLKALADEGIASLQGRDAWGHEGLAVSLTGELRVTRYSGSRFDNNCAALWPANEAYLAAIWCFCSSPEYNEAVRQVDQSLKVTNATLVKVPFDVDRWTKVAVERYPNGLPKPYSNDPTQRIFHGHPCGSVTWDEERKWIAHGPLRIDTTVLQIDALRLLGYRWPAEYDTEMDLAEEQRAWVEKTKALHHFEDEDGIVCIPSVRGERPAADRLLHLLHVAYGDDWHDGILTELLAKSGSASLDDWLRNRFFEKHCKLFHHRPFVWHIWDGRKRDGFHALVNYHKLAESNGKGRRLLESLAYSYLGDWISRQHDGVKRGEGGAEDRLVAALELQKRLVAILEGEPPFDLFVRWKADSRISPSVGSPTSTTASGSISAPSWLRIIPGGKKGAGILHAKPNIHWKKDRGKEPTRDQGQFPWFWDERQVHRRADQRCAFEDCRQARSSRGERG